MLYANPFVMIGMYILLDIIIINESDIWWTFLKF